MICSERVLLQLLFIGHISEPLMQSPFAFLTDNRIGLLVIGRRMFVDAIISQMDKRILQISGIVGYAGETTETVITEIDGQRTQRKNADITGKKKQNKNRDADIDRLIVRPCLSVATLTNGVEVC